MDPEECIELLYSLSSLLREGEPLHGVFSSSYVFESISESGFELVPRVSKDPVICEILLHILSFP
jgi:hypothetical protein